MNLPFQKYSGSGNDFILFDDRSDHFPLEDCSLISSLCHRQQGIGADGVILLQNSRKANFRMRVFNADGSEAEMCGNGIRCLVQWIEDEGISCTPLLIETMEATLLCTRKTQGVCVEMQNPKDLAFNQSVLLENQSYSLHTIHTGVPHAVLFVEDLEKAPVASLGRHLRHHPLFAPHGVNVNFAYLSPERVIFTRTFERGVEAETLACGTGAVAAAIITAKVYSLQPPLLVRPRSKETLHIDFEQDPVKNVRMTGPARKIFDGFVNLLNFSTILTTNRL